MHVCGPQTCPASGAQGPPCRRPHGDGPWSQWFSQFPDLWTRSGSVAPDSGPGGLSQPSPLLGSARWTEAQWPSSLQVVGVAYTLLCRDAGRSRTGRGAGLPAQVGGCLRPRSPAGHPPLSSHSLPAARSLRVLTAVKTHTPTQALSSWASPEDRRNPEPSRSLPRPPKRHRGSPRPAMRHPGRQ